MHRLLLALTSLVVALVLLPLGAASADPGGPTNTRLPGIGGAAVYSELLRAGPGRWDPREVTLTYRWFRDDRPVRGARERTYRPEAADLGHRLAVQVTATDADGDMGRAMSEPTGKVRQARLVAKRPPEVTGVQRFTHTVAATPGRWSSDLSRVRYQWLGNGKPIEGATHRRYRYAPQDVGRRVQVRVTAFAEGHRPARATSRGRAVVRHRVDVRRTVTYSVTTRGHVTASVSTFARLAQQTYDDPRGWRAKGVQFRRVRSGGSFTLVLAEARTVPSFSSACSATYSCRVGRFVIINQTRWQHASPAWNRAHESLRDYRHLVVNHETGHWLGKGHASCPGPGRLAPVMMQQSKGTQGCRFNPWPVPAELR